MNDTKSKKIVTFSNGKNVECDNPCRDFIMGGCGACGPKCHQPIEYYETLDSVQNKQ